MFDTTNLSTTGHPATRATYRRWLATSAVALLMSAAGAAHAQYVNLTVGGEFSPGVFGQISIGNNPPPPVINDTPVVAGTVVVGAPVMYLHVPEEHRRDWKHNCARYNACGRPVRFVKVDEKNPWWKHQEVRHEERHDDRRRARNAFARDKQGQ